MRQQTLNFGTIAECTDQGKVSKREAFQQTVPEMPTARARVYTALAKAGARGLTRHEIVEKTGLTLQSVCGRVGDLKKADQVMDSERRRLSPNGFKSAVVICAEFVGVAVPNDIDD